MSAEALLAAARAMSAELAPLTFQPPVTHVYDPLTYAWELHAQYLRRYADGPKRVLFLGMNPGPWGMAQTGVPFGEIAAVTGFLALDGPVGQPPHVHPKRPITGLATTRAEVSGRRVWGAVEQHWGTAEAFFAEHLIANYCPLVFMEASGKNRTPDQLPAAERRLIYQACDKHLRACAEILRPEWVIGIGGFAEGRAQVALAGLPIRLGRIAHPSPASPAANRGWEPLVAAELAALGLCSGKKFELA